MQTEKYCWPQILLHWISAVIICWVLVSGFYVGHADVEPATFHLVVFINVAASTLFIPIFLLRWLVRLTSLPPCSVIDEPLARRAAKALHEGLYWTVAAVLLSGVLMMCRGIDVFGWGVISPFVSDPHWRLWWFRLHVSGCVLLALQVAVHLGAVVWHEISGRRVLRRMLP